MDRSQLERGLKAAPRSAGFSPRFAALFLVSMSLGFGFLSLARPQNSAPHPAQLPSISLPADLQRILTDYEKAWSAKDPAGLARLFAEDGLVLPNGSHPVRGRENIQAFYARSGGPLALRAIHFETSGNVGFILGGYADQAGKADGGKFTLTLRKESGRWMIVSDMDSPNQRRTGGGS